jgi:molybdopterin synthase catalytic subunit
MIELTPHPIDEAALIERVRSSQAGAIVLCLGTTREFTAGKQTVARAALALRPEVAVSNRRSPARR